jgi:hypothetical protein
VLAYQQQNLILLTVPSHINIISVIYQFLGNKKKRSLRLKITLPALAGVATLVETGKVWFLGC